MDLLRIIRVDFDNLENRLDAALEEKNLGVYPQFRVEKVRAQ